MQPWDQVRKDEQPAVLSSIPGVAAQLPPTLAVPGHTREASMSTLRKLPSCSNAGGLSEETTIYTETRMLQDQTGRLRTCHQRCDIFVMARLTWFLVYIGDASTLSILQLIRIVVENTAGSDMGSPFIDDPKRHRILENVMAFPPDTRVPSPLPDRDTADVLIQSYFTNVGTQASVGMDKG